jgi:hypothetical protein
MVHWSLDGIAWHEFDASKIKTDLVSLVKAAAMVEHTRSKRGSSCPSLEK